MLSLVSLWPRRQPQPELPLYEYLLRQAEHLLRIGHAIPAGMTARVALERQLHKACERMSLPRKYRDGIQGCLKALKGHGVLTGRTVSRVDALVAVGNRISHGGRTSPSEVAQLILGVREVCVHALTAVDSPVDRARYLRRQADLYFTLAAELDPSTVGVAAGQQAHLTPANVGQEVAA